MIVAEIIDMAYIYSKSSGQWRLAIIGNKGFFAKFRQLIPLMSWAKLCKTMKRCTCGNSSPTRDITLKGAHKCTVLAHRHFLVCMFKEVCKKRKTKSYLWGFFLLGIVLNSFSDLFCLEISWCKFISLHRWESRVLENYVIHLKLHR